MDHLKQYDVAEALEQYLGDPADPENGFSFKQVMAYDEREEFPEEAGQLLDKWNLQDYYIPGCYGGKLASYEELLAIVKVVARRDLTVAIAHSSTYLGAVGIWLGGTETQKRYLAQIIKGRASMAFGLTEKAHGSDILATETQAIKNSDGYLLSGEKWLINNATGSTAITVFARTDVRGPRGFSLFLLEKESLEKTSYSHLPKVKTLGIRGADISGIRFENCPIPSDSLIGAPGFGFELTLKSLQITRTLCAGFSLGAANTALQTTLKFALERKLYGEPIFTIPQVRQTLVDAFLHILICDCMAIGAARGLHVATNQFSVWSSIIKFFVPVTIENTIRDLSVILGARYYLREEHDWGIFQKVLRDNALISLFDGNTAANLYNLVLQLRSLSLGFSKLKFDDHAPLSGRLEAIFSLEHPLPDFNPQNLTLFNQGCDDVLQGLVLSLNTLQTRNKEAEVKNEVLREIMMLTSQVIDEIKKQNQLVIHLAKTYGRQLNKSPELFELAKRYCTLHAAAACIQMWVHNNTLLDSFFGRGEWLVLALKRLINHSTAQPLSTSYVEQIGEEMVSRLQENKLFSIIPLQLAKTRR